MHCPNLSTPSKPPRTPCGSKDVNSTPVSSSQSQKSPRRHSSKKCEPSECRSRSTNHRVGHSREKPEQRRSSKNCARKRRRHYSEPKTLTVTPQGAAGSRRRHQSESRGRRRALKDSSSSRRRLDSRRTELEPRKQPSRKNDDTPRRPTARRERRCTVGMRVSLFSAPDAAKKQIVIPQQKRYQLRSTIALRDVPQSNSGELPDTESASQGVPGVNNSAGKESAPSKLPSDGSFQPVQQKLTPSGRIAQHPPHELSPHKGTAQPLPPEEAADGVSHRTNHGGDPKENPDAEVAQKSKVLKCERVSENKSPRTLESSTKDRTADKKVLEFPLMKPSPEQGAMQMSLEKSAEGGGLQSSPVGVAKGNSVQKAPDEGIQEPSVSKQLAYEGTAQSPPKASGSNTSALKVTGVEGLTPCSSRELRNRRRCREVQPLRRRLRAVNSENTKGKGIRDEVKKV
ncbi:hypothetical protein TELCIR_10351 [Teladorsagia circumcincta]|uniref:Uncharacterized protein n=1 Tax=Teladorsagia circumcincta TaxID=45464 RepID=A0A2G9UDR7_TELCI|nr:hypothetical protein TELCIR_10351 [Teladorsagia circumcincta]